MFPATRFKGRRIAVLGLARSGLASAQALQAGGAEIAAWDDGEEARREAAAAGIPLRDLSQADFSAFTALVLSPGIPLTHPRPHWSVDRAHAAGIEVIGDTEIFIREIAGTGSRLVAITGTNGKSTTTALTGHVLRSAGLDAHVGGNIGTAVFQLPPPESGRVYVLELSSYQIDLTPGLKPDAAILMNLTPDHLDRHGDMAGYAAVKAKIFARQSTGDVAICSVDDDWSAAIAAALPSAATHRPFSVLRRLDDGISAPDGVLQDCRKGEAQVQLDLRDLNALRGRHNWQNACAAYGAGRAMGVSADAIAEGFRSFPGLVHRMEEVARLGNVIFVNDSKATNADAAEKALLSFDTIYWIAGGLMKAGGIEPLRPLFGRIVRAYLIGRDAPALAGTLEGITPYRICGTIEQATEAAARDARNEQRDSAVVLLSPACASFDQFPNFEVRGDAFRKAVKDLLQETAPC
ncbi:MAG TPA: UDP-N-acetylmuramoyl-L-alanine--D-glutamate ligase [Aestuariivirgaceae bacterium]|jgi:UDP-N-acetylmuramoylalanine--D-glutamate ligase|nr:UDP-N-acetylmuramoyl-L-alanine--D-glutamate ligase [Aestuariivirgaceae bacterium]